MHHLLLSALLVTHLAALPQAPEQAPVGPLPVVNIGAVLDGPWVRNDEIVALFQQEIRALSERDFDIRFPRVITGDWTIEAVRRNLDSLLADPGIDLVLTVGVLVSNEAVQPRDLPKPVIAPFVINRDFQGAPAVPNENGRLSSGVPNLSYLTTPWESGRDLEEFYQIAPFTKVAVFVDARLLQMTEAIAQGIRTVADFYEVGVQVIPVTTTAQEGLDALEPDVDAVMVSSLLNMPDPEIDALIEGINARRLPSMALFGRDQVERGLLLGVAPNTNFARVARRVAIHTQSILMGGEAGSLPIEVAQPRALVLNMETARIIDFSPSWDTLTDAELINVENTAEPLLTLNDAIQQAVDANLAYLASARAVAAGEELVLEARAPLLPRLDSALTGLSIDATRSEQSFGQQSQRSLAGSLVFTQLLYADAAWTGYRVQQLLQETTVLARETVRLDTIQAASVAYLNVLISSTFEQIQLQNVELSRTNLDLAQARQTVGVATRAEVYRWQSEIATDRSAVIDAIVQRNLAEIELNRLRNRPLEEDFRTVPDIADAEFRRPMADLVPYIGDQISFEIFREFMVQDGLRDAPELRALAAGIDAQQRVLTNAQRNFWLPDLFFQGDLGYLFARSEPGATGGGSGTPALFEPPKTTWSLAVNAAYPIYRGGSRYAERQRAREEIDLLRLQRRATAERIEQLTRASLHVMVGSYAQIDLAEQAAEAALQNLDLVQDSYSQGVVNITDLIDAQNATLTAQLTRATAVYQFMINLTNVGRAISSFDFVNPTDAATRQAWLDRVEEFFRVARQRRNR